MWQKYSLSMTLLALFIASWIGQAFTQYQHINQPDSFVWEFLASTLENWQSEFLQLMTFVLLTVKLRHEGSPQSK